MVQSYSYWFEDRAGAEDRRPACRPGWRPPTRMLTNVVRRRTSQWAGCRLYPIDERRTSLTSHVAYVSMYRRCWSEDTEAIWNWSNVWWLRFITLKKFVDFPKWMPDKYFLRIFKKFGKDSSLQGVTGKRRNQQSASDSWEKESKVHFFLYCLSTWYPRFGKFITDSNTIKDGTTDKFFDQTFRPGYHSKLYRQCTTNNARWGVDNLSPDLANRDESWRFLTTYLWDKCGNQGP